jgi:hypothetical protein
MFRIGIDFDNTIACYDSAFVSVAALLGIPLRDTPSNKVEVKREIQSQAQGDLVWQRLQGQVYGTHMHLATPFPGIHEFISLAQMRGHEVFIVSHKSIYGHFDADRIPLRSQAKLWLNENKGRFVLTPMPGLSTHCMDFLMSPIIDWKKINENAIIHK